MRWRGARAQRIPAIDGRKQFFEHDFDEAKRVFRQVRILRDDYRQGSLT